MFTVKSASKDRKAPVIKKISINKNTVSPGAKVTITCEIQDDSELNLDPERSYLYMKNKSQISQPFVFVKKRKNVYTATQTIPENYVNGTYNLSTVVLTDAVGNSLRASGKDYPDLLFTVKNASSDRKAPVVSKVTIDKQSASPGDKLKISVYYSDSSEIVSGGLNSYIVFRNGSFTSNRISLKKKKEGLLTGTLTVDSSYMNGTYELWMMRITDVVGNSLQVNGASTYPLVKFKVKNGNKPSDYDRNGWFMMNGKWYFNDQNRKLVKGWMYYNAKWYYMNLKTGEMQTDWVKVNGKWYYLDPTSGAMQTGWLQLTENWYFLDPSSGAMQTGWLQWKEKWYYLKPSGKMCEKEWFGGYRFSKSGAWTYKYIGSWKKNSIGWWFGDTSGWYAKNTRIKIDDVYYRFNKEGYWVE
ncbi:MAG: N-acetylmuramoyl-L-alanine amidase family protein [Parasporobacterium sp.]|nr:N-acetylmuramoyl-L-alanine amidase family protein [Parasporobacterium sp.]